MRRKESPVLGETMEASLPAVTPWLLRGFLRYVRWYMRRNINAVRISRSGAYRDPGGLPMVVYCNHSTWWDPLIGFLLASRLAPERTVYAPIDDISLRKYPVLGRLGLFGIAKDSARGAREFLRVAQAILARPMALMLVTPQGRFADVRERPVQLKPGLAHLAVRLEQACFQPVALEMTFWEERTPEVLVHFGEPLRKDQADECDASEWNRRLETNLATAMDRLAEESMAFDPAAFDILATGRAGVGGFYDRFRALRAWAKGKAFDAKHRQS